MMKEPTIIKRGRLTYVLHPDKVIVAIGDSQYVSYNQYDNYNRQGITQFRKTLLNSNENEYTTPSEQMSLANQCGIRGTGTSRPKELNET